MKLKYHTQLLQLEYELDLATKYATTRINYDKNDDLMAIRLSLKMPEQSKEFNDLSNCMHFASLFDHEYPSESDMKKLDEWSNATIRFIVCAASNYRLSQPKYKPTNDSFIEMFSSYKKSLLVQINNYPPLLTNPDVRNNTRDKLSMCDTYIDRFSSDNDWRTKIEQLFEKKNK